MDILLPVWHKSSLSIFPLYAVDHFLPRAPNHPQKPSFQLLCSPGEGREDIWVGGDVKCVKPSRLYCTQTCGRWRCIMQAAVFHWESWFYRATSGGFWDDVWAHAWWYFIISEKPSSARSKETIYPPGKRHRSKCVMRVPFLLFHFPYMTFSHLLSGYSRREIIFHMKPWPLEDYALYVELSWRRLDIKHFLI